MAKKFYGYSGYSGYSFPGLEPLIFGVRTSFYLESTQNIYASEGFFRFFDNPNILWKITKKPLKMPKNGGFPGLEPLLFDVESSFYLEKSRNTHNSGGFFIFFSNLNTFWIIPKKPKNAQNGGFPGLEPLIFGVKTSFYLQNSRKKRNSGGFFIFFSNPKTFWILSKKPLKMPKNGCFPGLEPLLFDVRTSFYFQNSRKTHNSGGFFIFFSNPNTFWIIPKKPKNAQNGGFSGLEPLIFGLKN